MPRRGENIFKRKDGRWEARYVKEITFDNRKKYGSVYASTYTQVKSKREDIYKLLNDKGVTENVLNNENIGYFIIQWLETNKIRLKLSTYAKYHDTINNYLLPYFKEIKIRNLNNKIIESFTIKLLEKGKTGYPLSPKTVKDILVLLKSIINYIETTNNINLNIKIIYPKNAKKENTVLTKEQYISLNKVLLKDIDTCKFGVLIAMATGLRIGELCALKWKNIYLNDNYIYIDKTMQRIKNLNSDTPKTKIIEESPKSATSNRKIPIPENLLNLFYKFKNNSDCYLLTGQTNRFIEPRVLERRFSKYTKEAGIEKANFHMLRHTFATMCIEEGFEIKCLSEILGHSGSQITLDRYVHSSFKLKKNWINKFSNQNISCL